jgi:hypothetical protein
MVGLGGEMVFDGGLGRVFLGFQAGKKKFRLGAKKFVVNLKSEIWSLFFWEWED